MVDFAALASVDVEAVPESKLMPVGTYRWAVEKVPEEKLSASGASTLINFRMKCLGPIEDFEDPDALEAFGKVVGAVRILMFTIPAKRNEEKEDKETFDRRVIDSVNKLKKFLVKDLKVEDGKSIKEKMSLSPGHQCLVTVKHELDNRDNETMQERLGKTAPLDE